MSKQPRSLSNEARPKSGTFSLETFLILAREYQADIMASRSLVEDAHKVFNEEDIIGLHQRSSVVKSISKLNDYVQEFYELLEANTLLPRAICPLRYPLLIALHHVDKQAKELALLINASFFYCSALSPREIIQRQAILCLFESLLQDSEGIVENINILLDQARFQERQFVNLK